MTTNATGPLSLRSAVVWFYNVVNNFDGPQAEAIFVACIVFTIGLSILCGCFIVGRINDMRRTDPTVSQTPYIVPASAQAYDYNTALAGRFGKPRQGWQ